MRRHPRGGFASWALPGIVMVALAFGCIRWQATIAAGDEAAKLTSRADKQNNALIRGCGRTNDRNAFLRVRFRPDPLTADRYMPLLDCTATVAGGGVEVPLSTSNALKLVHATRVRVEHNQSLFG